MDNNELEMIEHYLSGEMPLLEKRAFEKGLLEDADLLERVRQYKITLGVLDRMQKEGNLQNLATNKPSRIIPLKQMSFALVACILLMIICPAVFKSLKADSLFSQYYLHHSDFNAERSSSSQGLNTIPDWQLAFNEEAHNEVINLLEPKANELSESQILALGKTYLKLGEPEKALAVFQNRNSDASIWYSALAYVQAKQFEEAKDELSKIEANSSYFVQAKNLTSKLDSFFY